MDTKVKTYIAVTACLVAAFGLFIVSAIVATDYDLDAILLLVLSLLPLIILSALFYRNIVNETEAMNPPKKLQFYSEKKNLEHEKHEKGKTDFMSLVSHQLVTPMSTINWYTEMLLNGDVGEVNTEQKDYLNTIYSGSKRLADIVYALLNVSRLELYNFIVEPVLLDISELSHQTVVQFSKLLKGKNITVDEKYENIPPMNVDPNLLSIVFQNLLSNAIKYSPEKSTISISISQVEDSAVITFTDKGFGIPEKQQKEIFSKMFRADNARVSDEVGSGLGLFIARYIVEYSKGTLTFVSSEKGTEFTISIPLSGMLKKEGTKKLTAFIV